MKLWIEKLLVSMGAGEQVADGLATGALFALIALGAYLVYWVLRNYLLKLIHKVTLKTSNRWDDALMESGVFHRFMRLIPLTFILLCIDRAMPGHFVLVKRILFALVILVGARAIEAFLNTVMQVYQQGKSEQGKDIDGSFHNGGL